MAMRLKKGLIHIYTGNGKGKTTAAFGLGMRAVGNGLKVCLFQFIKGKGITYGEVEAAKRLTPKFRIVAFRQSHPFFQPPARRKKAIAELKRSTKEGLREVSKVMSTKRYDIIILDEIITALRDKFIDLQSVIYLIDSKPKSTELVLTGRGAPKGLIKKADYVTEMRNIKHPFSKGIIARCGIEF